MTSLERMFALYIATNYVLASGIKGDFVECGVWKGGSALLIALILKDAHVVDRKIYLYDTFEGMVEPDDIDHRIANYKIRAHDIWKKNATQSGSTWCDATLGEVKKIMRISQYPVKNLVYIKGKVEQTIPKVMPSTISLLRLDTDWYVSTKHELNHLYPRLTKSGVLLIDDYGYWAGSKKAVDQYFDHKPILLQRIDNSSRMLVKQ